MRILALTILLLWTSVAYGAQSITINEGTTNFGPVSPNVATRYMSFSYEPVPNPAVTLTGVIQYSTDGGKTYLDLCRFTASKIATLITIERKFPVGTTNIKGSVTLVGGSLTLTKQANLTSKNKNT